MGPNAASISGLNAFEVNQIINMATKEVHHTTDAKKAAGMVQTGEWIITGAAFKASGKIEWILFRV